MKKHTSLIRLAKVGIAAFVINMGLSSGAFASDTFSQANISLKSANKIARNAIRECRKEGFRVSVAVVDSSGVLVTHMRNNGAGPHTVTSAFRKAFTSASLRRPTGELAELIVNVPTTAGLQFMNDNLVILQGGLPITINGKVVGAVGVGGAPGGQIDENCARRGIQSLSD